VKAMTRVEKPWGYELWWAQTDRYVAKILHIEAGLQLSLQYHERKDETIYIQSGEMVLVVDRRDGEGLQEITMRPGDAFHITPGTTLTMRAITDVDVLEASTPEVEDVVRLEDSYGRVD